jgi:hypothetical protein
MKSGRRRTRKRSWKRKRRISLRKWRRMEEKQQQLSVMLLEKEKRNNKFKCLGCLCHFLSYISAYMPLVFLMQKRPRSDLSLLGCKSMAKFSLSTSYYKKGLQEYNWMVSFSWPFLFQLSHWIRQIRRMLVTLLVSFVYTLICRFVVDSLSRFGTSHCSFFVGEYTPM